MRLLDELGAEFERVARETRPRRRRRWLVVAAVVLAGGVSAVPATRAGIDDMANWLTGDAGQPAGDDAPAWLHTDVRVIARSEGAGLYVSRRGDYIDFAVGEGFGTGASVEDWRKTFAELAPRPRDP